MKQYIDPDREQFLAFKDLPRDTPLNMLNLVKFKAIASYEDGTVATGAEAYGTYGKESGPIFKRVGGAMLWRGKPECMLIGPVGETEAWDVAFIASYPNSTAMLEMLADPVYQEAVKHRQAAVETSRLLRCGEVNGDGSFG